MNDLLTWNGYWCGGFIIPKDASAGIEQDVVQAHRLQPALKGGRVGNSVGAHVQDDLHFLFFFVYGQSFEYPRRLRFE